MATIAERWHFDPRQLLAKDPGILGRAAKTVWVDRTPMKDRIEGVTNSTNPQEGGAMTRRDFLRISAIGGAGAAIAACAPNLLRTPATNPATAVSTAPAKLPTKPAVELGIQYNEVAVLDEASAVAEMANIGIPLDQAYAGAIKEFQNKKDYPQLKLEGAKYDKFAIVVPYVGMNEKKLRYIYPFIGVEAVDANSSFVAIMIPLYDKQGALTGFAAESLEATEVEFAGAKRGALSVFRDPATGADISPRPVFIYPTDIAGWKQMTDAQRKAQAIIFIPYNLPSPKEIRITGGKLAKLVVDMATATPEPQKPTETPKMTLENWKKVFTGPFVGDDGKTYDLGIIFREDVNTVLTDPGQVFMLPFGTPMMILNPDGTITIYADPDVASQKAEEGAIILAAKGLTPDVDASYALAAVTLQYQKGNTNFYVQFRGNSASGMPAGFPAAGMSIDLNKRVLQTTLADGTIITPIMGMPDHFKVARNGKGSLTLEQAGIKITNPDNWLDQVIKAGYNWIIVFPH